MSEDIFKSVYGQMFQVKGSRFDQLKRRFDPSLEMTDEQKKQKIIQLLKIAIVDEQLAEYNYFASYNKSKTQGKTDFDPEFEQHQKQEYDHRHKLVLRLRQLDVESILDIPFEEYSVESSHQWNQQFGINSLEILKNRLTEEEQAVEYYTMAVEFLRKSSDSTTLRLFRQILGDEERHVLDLRDLYNEYKKD